MCPVATRNPLSNESIEWPKKNQRFSFADEIHYIVMAKSFHEKAG